MLPLLLEDEPSPAAASFDSPASPFDPDDELAVAGSARPDVSTRIEHPARQPRAPSVVIALRIGEEARSSLGLLVSPRWPCVRVERVRIEERVAHFFLHMTPVHAKPSGQDGGASGSSSTTRVALEALLL